MKALHYFQFSSITPLGCTHRLNSSIAWNFVHHVFAAPLLIKLPLCTTTYNTAGVKFSVENYLPTHCQSAIWLKQSPFMQLGYYFLAMVLKTLAIRNILFQNLNVHSILHSFIFCWLIHFCYKLLLFNGAEYEISTGWYYCYRSNSILSIFCEERTVNFHFSKFKVRTEYISFL